MSRKSSIAVWLLAMTLALGLVTTTAHAAAEDDVVVLKTGKTLRGVILEENTKSVQISTRSGSTYRIPRSRISRVQKAGLLAENRRGRTTASDAAESSEPTTINEETGALKIGPLIGVNFADASLSPDFSTSTRTGLMVGGFFEAKLTRLFYIEPDLMYAQQGFAQVAGSNSVIYKYDTLKVPVFAKIKFDPGRSDLRLHVMAGPSFAIKVNASQTTNTAATSTTTDIGSQTQSFDFGIDFGGGLEYWFTPKIAARADLRYDLGLTNVSSTGQSVKNADTYFLMGVSVAL